MKLYQFIIENKTGILLRVVVAGKTLPEAQHDLFYKVYETCPAEELEKFDPDNPPYTVISKKLMKRADIIKAMKDLEFTDLNPEVKKWLAHQKYTSMMRGVTDNAES